MRPTFFDPNTPMNSPSWRFENDFYVNPWMMRDRYLRNAAYGAGVVGGCAVVSELLTHRLVRESPRIMEVTETFRTLPGRRDVITTERLEIVTTRTTWTTLVVSEPVVGGSVTTGGGGARASAAEGQRVG